MAEEQANQTSETYWRRVVLEWVKCSGLIPSDQFNNSIESIRLHSAFDAFKSKTVATYPIEENTVIEFVRVHFPDFELELDDIYGIPKHDNVYIFSLMLYFSCVRWSIPYYQNVCKGFEEQHQYSVKTFLNSFVVDCDQMIRIDRNFLDAAITKATRSAPIVGEKQSKLKVMSSSDAQIFSSTPVHKPEMKKPSPHTPKMEWKVNSLKHLLESVRSENFSLETQNEKLAQRIKQLNDDKQRYLIKIKAMQVAEQLSDDSSLRQKAESNDRLNDHFRKQLQEKDALIELLQDEISKAKETACMEMERISVVKTNNLCLKRDIHYLENSIETLNQELSKQKDNNVLQIEIINDLRRFIRENRLTYSETLAEPLDCSFECFEKFVENYSADNSRCLEPENLASTVVEVKLKDQEKENERLLSEIEKQKLEIKLLKEDHHREKVEITATVTELQKSLKENAESHKCLQSAFEQQKATIKRQEEELKQVQAASVQLIEDTHAHKVEVQNQLEDHKRQEAEMNTKMAELQKALGNVEVTKKQLQKALEKEVAKTSDLSIQLENITKQHIEDRKREHAEVNEKVAELQESLAEMVQSKNQLAVALEKQKAKVEQQDEDHKLKEAEMNTKIVELQKALDNVEVTKKQLQEALEKEVSKTSDLSIQLQNIAKQNIEDRKREHAEVNEKVAELQESLAEMVQSRNQLAVALEKQKAKVEQQDEDHKLKEAEMNMKIVELQKALGNVEVTKKQLQEAFEKEVTKTSDLSLQLENLSKQHIEDRKREHAEVNEKVAELQESLAEMVESKNQLAAALEGQKAKVEQQDEDHKLKEAEMNTKMAELQKALDNVEVTKKQLQEALEKEVAKTSGLSIQLENIAKQHIEDRKREHAEVNEKVAELQESLAEMVESKNQLAVALEKQKVKVEQQDEDHKLKEAEMNTKIAELQKALDNVEVTKKQLQEALEKEVSKTSDLSIQLENIAKQHIEDRKREHAEVNEKVAELQESLAEMVESKNQLAAALGGQKAKVEQQDEDHKLKEAEMNTKIVELQKALDNVEVTKKQLQEAFEKEVTKTSDLSLQLENLSKQHIEDRKREHAEVNEKIAELQELLAEMVESKNQLAAALEGQKAKVEQQDEDHKLKEAEMNTKIAELQKALDNVEVTKKQLQEALEKEVAKTSDLSIQLENIAKQHIEDRKREHAEVNEKVAELQESLAEMVESKNQLAAALEGQKAKVEQQDEDHKLKEAEMNTKMAELQKALDNVEVTKKQLQKALEKEVAKTSDLSIQLENIAKQHIEDRKREHAEVNEKVAELQESLAEMVESKNQLAVALEKQKAKVEQQDEDHKLKEAEMKAMAAILQRSLDDVENTRKELQEAFEKQVAKTSDLSLQLENLSKQHVEVCSMKDEMKEEAEELSSQYEMVKKRSDDLESQCIKLLNKVSTQNEEINALKTDLEKTSIEHQIQQKEWMQGTVTVSVLQKAVEEKESQLQALAKEHEERQQKYEKCNNDNEILCAKLYMARSELTTKGEAWTKERSSLQEVLEKTKKAYEAKVREARIEFEDKMERMKERMKDLHKEAKFKLEREREELITTVEQSYKKRLESMEVRCATLQKQVAEMNERDLQNRKENQLLHTKLKTLEENKSERKSLLLPPPAQARLRCNLKMEDEEGELFNNMYLADLQNSRCVSPVPSEGGFERFSELMRRNSMRLPHLRTHYAALAPDGDLPADDTRENVSTTFDDSSTGLITRRKVSGITSYKRPGPPTPSKKAGRLSLSGALPGVGSEIQYKEALRDSNVNAGGEGSTAGGSGSLTASAAAEHGQATSGCRAGRTKTPGKFKQMLSSSSLLSNFQRDEFSPDASLPSPRAASALAAATVQTVSSASRNAHYHPTAEMESVTVFSALPGRSVMQLHGNSLYNIRRQQMLRRQQRNRQVDLQRKLDGSPLRTPHLGGGSAGLTRAKKSKDEEQATG